MIECIYIRKRIKSRSHAFGRGDDTTVVTPHRAQSSQFELFEFILLFTLDKQFPVEQFEATSGNTSSVEAIHVYMKRRGGYC